MSRAVRLAADGMLSVIRWVRREQRHRVTDELEAQYVVARSNILKGLVKLPVDSKEPNLRLPYGGSMP